MTRIAFMPGSFDPFTIGHMDLLVRGLTIFDRIVIGIGVNAAKSCSDKMDSANMRAEHIRTLLANEPRVDVTVYSGLTYEAALACGACCLLRGARSATDFDYEMAIAQTNLTISSIDTVILPASPNVTMISSSIVRDLQRHGHDVTPFLP